MIYGWWRNASEEVVADTEGFEPSVEGLPLRLLSREVVSAAHPRVRMLQRQIGLATLLCQKTVKCA
jgi:hypothetical protein